MVCVYMQVTGARDLEIEQAVPRKEIQHMVQESDPRRNLRLSSAIEVDHYPNVGFACSSSFVARSAHF
jgi:hypothetical protein